MHITGLYVGLSALLVVVLSVRVVMRRVSARISLGDGDDKELKKRIRAQANAIEYLPLALLLLLTLELNQTQPIVLHACGIVLVAARVVHGFGLSRTGGVSPERLAGTAITWLVMLAMALLLIWQFTLR
ncbi:MAG TPA: MAPEG family protein [Rudaea sp.]|nr:MAPEG family protein [Rudaea sp.]